MKESLSLDGYVYEVRNATDEFEIALRAAVDAYRKRLTMAWDAFQGGELREEAKAVIRPVRE